MLRTEVLVVGAGPVGLGLALELGMQGRQVLLVEQQDRGGLAPRAKTTNVRSRELMRRWGMADRLAAASPFGVDYPSNVVFATRLAGRELARFANAFSCSPQRDDRFAEHAQWVPQYRVEAALLSRVREFDQVELRTGTALEALHETADGVQVQLRDRATGQAQALTAQYVVGCDGARSTVRERLGLRLEGRSPLGQHHNIVFRAPGLAQRHALGPAVMYWLVNREVPSVVTPLDRGDLWTFGCPLLEHAPDADPVPLIRAALGLPDQSLEVLSRDQWTGHSLLANRYRVGRVFLAGDACHLHPPFGGHGMNMGLADAVDLGWKLAATLAGWGGPALLDSYETERRQVHRRVLDEAVTNLSRNAAALWQSGLEDDGPEGDAVRARVAATILSGKRQEFDSLAVVLGSHYEASPVLVREAADRAPVAAAPGYVPSARPGHRAPHAWLAEGRAIGASLYDHLAPQALTLLVTRAAAAPAAAQVAAAAAEQGLPLQLRLIDRPALQALYAADLVLIRPDQHVAWRGATAAQACAALPTVAGHLPARPACT